MGKSFDRNIKSDLKIRDGQAVWSNQLKRIANNSTMNTASNVEMRCYPYAKMVVGLDFLKDIDADPLHTSLPTGTYDGIALTHSDTCLAALYPDLAASLEPTVEWWVRTQYKEYRPTTTTLIIDAIGVLLASGSEIYSVALDAARNISGYRVTDENGFHLGAFLFGGRSGNTNYSDNGHLAGQQLTDPNNIILPSSTYSNADQLAAVAALETNWNATQGLFDTKINSKLQKVFISPTLKAIVELMCSNVIKFRYADADTNRYGVFACDAYMNSNSTPSFTNAASFIENLATNHVDVILQRYSFMADLMRSLGFVRLNGAKPREMKDGASKTDRIVINTANNNINIVYDENDVIKNVVDHQAINYDEIINTLKGTSPAVKPIDVYKLYMFTESDSYLNNALEINDALLMDDGIISVLFHNGMRIYNSAFIDYYKANGSNAPTITYSKAYPKPLLVTSGTNLPAATAAKIQAVNELFNNTGLLDPTWVPVFTSDGATPALFEQEFEHINTGINTYTAPVDDVAMIDSYAVTFICFNSKAIAENNDKLSKNPDINNSAS